MVQLVLLPFSAALLMTIAWVSTLGGSWLVILSGLAIGVAVFVVVMLSQRKVLREAAKR